MVAGRAGSGRGGAVVRAVIAAGLFAAAPVLGASGLAAQERAHQEQSGVQQQLMHQAYASTQALERGLEEQRDAAAAEAARHAAQLASVEAGALLSHPYS